MIDRKSKYWYMALALLVIPLSGIGIDIYVPSLPAVSEHFQVDKFYAQLTISVYMFGLAVMQLFGGSISDSYGRKRPFLFAMLIFIITTLCVPFSANMHQLLWLRFIQGGTVAITVVPMRSVVSDLFTGDEYNRMTNYTVMAWSIGPIVAPVIGGYLQHYIGWEANFYFLAIYSIISFFLIWFFLPETSEYRYPFEIRAILSRYRSIMFHRHYCTGLLIDGLAYSLIILFSIVGPFLIQNVLLYSPVAFGHMALLMGLGWFLGAMTNRFLLHIDHNKKIKYALWIMFFIGITMLVGAMIEPLNIFNILLPIFFMVWIGGMIFPSYFARSISYFPKTTGSANAFFGAAVFFIASISSACAAFLKSSSEIPLAASYVGIILLCFLIYYLDLIRK